MDASKKPFYQVLDTGTHALHFLEVPGNAFRASICDGRLTYLTLTKEGQLSMHTKLLGKGFSVIGFSDELTAIDCETVLPKTSLSFCGIDSLIPANRVLKFLMSKNGIPSELRYLVISKQ